jgi:nicotinamidase-related amidase
MFPDVVEPVRRLAAAAGGRTVVTRWVPSEDPQGSWAAYLEAWPFANVAHDDPLLEVVPELDGIGHHRVSLPTFGKWGTALKEITGPTPHLVLAGVSTDCCVVSTALAAADAGATTTVATDACAGSTPENHRLALGVMALYPPQITLATTAEVLG